MLRYVLLSFIIAGCSLTQVPGETQHLELTLPDAPEMKMRPVNWEIRDSKICLSPENYSNLSLNTEDIKAFVIYQNQVINIMKEYHGENGK